MLWLYVKFTICSNLTMAHQGAIVSPQLLSVTILCLRRSPNSLLRAHHSKDLETLSLAPPLQTCLPCPATTSESPSSTQP